MSITWEQKLIGWYQGINLPSYPDKIKSQFFYETSPIMNLGSDKNGHIIIGGFYEEDFIEDERLNKQIENNSSFIEYLNKPDEYWVTSFYNPSKTSLLIIPTNKDCKKYTSIKLFIDNASITEKEFFWSKVAHEAINMLKKHNKIWISTHGLGVPYFHLRIDIIPKYYHNNILKNM